MGNLLCRIFCIRCFFILLAFISNLKLHPTNKMIIYMSVYLIFQASEKSAQAKKWAEPHIETAKMVMPICSCTSISFVLSWANSWLTLLLSMIEEMDSC
jgi:hypothetical protein